MQRRIQFGAAFMFHRIRFGCVYAPNVIKDKNKNGKRKEKHGERDLSPGRLARSALPGVGLGRTARRRLYSTSEITPR